MSPAIHIGKLPASVNLERLVADGEYATTVLWGSGNSGVPLGCLVPVLILIVCKAIHTFPNVYVRAVVLILSLGALVYLWRRKIRPEAASQMSDTFRIDDSLPLLEMDVMDQYGTPIGPADPEYGQAVLLSEAEVVALAKMIGASNISARQEVVGFLTATEPAEERIVLFIV